MLFRPNPQLLVGLLLFLPLVVFSQNKKSTTVSFSYQDELGVNVEGRFSISVIPHQGAAPMEEVYLNGPGSPVEIQFSNLRFLEGSAPGTQLKFDKAVIGNSGLRWEGKGLKSKLDPGNDQLTMKLRANAEGSVTVSFPIEVVVGRNFSKNINIKSLGRKTINNPAALLKLNLSVFFSGAYWARINAMNAQPYGPRTKEAGKFLQNFGGEAIYKDQTDAIQLIDQAKRREYPKARQSISSLTYYMDVFRSMGQDDEVRKAKSRIDSLSWEKALASGNCGELSAYLVNHPKGIFNSQATAQLQQLDRAAWAQTTRAIAAASRCEGKIKALNAYLSSNQHCSSIPLAYRQQANQQLRTFNAECDTPDPLPLPEKSTIEIAWQRLQDIEELSCSDLEAFVITYGEETAFPQFEEELNTLKKRYCPIGKPEISRLPNSPLGFHIELENFVSPLKIDSIFLATEGNYFVEIIHQDSLGIDLRLGEAVDIVIPLRDSRDSLIAIELKGSLKEIELFDQSFDEETGLLSFSLTGGQPPYYFRMRSEGQEAFVRGIRKLTISSRKQAANGIDSIYTFQLRPSEQMQVAQGGNYELLITDLTSDQKPLPELIPLTVNTQSPGWWKYLLLPLLGMVGFLYWRNKDTQI